MPQTCTPLLHFTCQACRAKRYDSQDYCPEHPQAPLLPLWLDDLTDQDESYSQTCNPELDPVRA
jgi:hypothetical protein